MNEIEKKVRLILKEHTVLKKPVDQIESGEDLVRWGMNSINVIKLIVAVEEEFGFQFDDEELTGNKMHTIENIVAYIKEKLS